MFTDRTKRAILKGILTKKVPIYVQYAVTKRCNFFCKMCASSASRKMDRELTLKEIKILAEVLDRLNVGIILITGGEPLLRDDIVEIISIFSEKGFTVRLQTNAVLADEEKIKAMYKAGLKELTISLESLNPRLQDEITGQPGSYDEIIKAIALFSQILPCKDTILGINTVVSRQNFKELPDIIRFVNAIGFYSSLIPVHLSLYADDDYIIRNTAPDFVFDKQQFDEIEQVYKEVIALKKQGYNIYNSYKFLENSPKFLEGERIDWQCDSPHLYFAISPAGNFLPCVDIKSSVSMLDPKFVDLYNSSEFIKTIREKVNKCRGCYYACWPEITYFCTNPMVLTERIIFGIKAALAKRSPLTYGQCLQLINNIKNTN